MHLIADLPTGSTIKNCETECLPPTPRYLPKALAISKQQGHGPFVLPFQVLLPVPLIHRLQSPFKEKHSAFLFQFQNYASHLPLTLIHHGLQLSLKERLAMHVGPPVGVLLQCCLCVVQAVLTLATVHDIVAAIPVLCAHMCQACHPIPQHNVNAVILAKKHCNIGSYTELIYCPGMPYKCIRMRSLARALILEYRAL